MKKAVKKTVKHSDKSSAKHVGALQVSTPSDLEIAMTRVFDAPRTMVWDAFTKPEHLKRWLVRSGWSMPVCEVDLKPGGSYRYLWRGPDGTEMGMRGVYREVVRPERIVCTEVFDQKWYEGEALDTTTFVEGSGKTTLTTTVRYASQAVRDAVLKSPAAEGLAKNYDNLAELLASTAGRAQ